MMDYLHLQFGDGEDEDDTESVSSEDSLERRNELEARLYSIVHHNDLSHSLPSDFGERFVVDCSENGEVVVSVNEDLDLKTNRDIIINKINLIKSSNQSIDIENNDEEGEYEDKLAEGEKHNRLGEYIENIETRTVKDDSIISIDKNPDIFQACGISSSVMNKIKSTDVSQKYKDSNIDKNQVNNTSVLHGYQNRIESDCMLRNSDWKTNAKMEYISLKTNFKDVVETGISDVASDSSKREVKNTQRTGITETSFLDIRQTWLQDNELEYLDDVELDNKISKTGILLKREYQFYNKRSRNKFIRKKKMRQQENKVKRLFEYLKKLRYIKTRRNNLNTTASVDKEPVNVDVSIKSIDNSGNSVCDSNHKGVTYMNVPSVAVINECIVLDSDAEVIELESDLPQTKRNVQNLDGNHSHSSDDLICNFVNTCEKQQSDVINLESSGDEQSGLNNKNGTTLVKDKKLPFLGTPKKWTKKMIKFYCESSEERRRFDCIKLIKEMRKTSAWSDWVINKDDLSAIKKKKKYGQRCRRCLEFGHHMWKCKAPIRPVVCYMCGEQNHRAERCPNSICLYCGRPTVYYTEKCSSCIRKLMSDPRCKVCNGCHWMEVCPDLWRCYHLTTKDGPVVIPNEQKVNPKKCCWVCAQQGHFAHECSDPYYGSRGIQTSCFVMNYNTPHMFRSGREIILSDNACAKLDTDIGENFLQNLCDKTKVRIDLIKDNLPVIKVFGNVNEWKFVKHEISTFVGETLYETVNQAKNNGICVASNEGKNIMNSTNGTKRKRKSNKNKQIQIL